MLLQVSADLPARARIVNMKQFNGAYECLYCENPGTTAPRKPLHRFWPDIPGAPQRTHATVLENAREATRLGDAVSHTRLTLFLLFSFLSFPPPPPSLSHPILSLYPCLNGPLQWQTLNTLHWPSGERHIWCFSLMFA